MTVSRRPAVGWAAASLAASVLLLGGCASPSAAPTASPSPAASYTDARPTTQPSPDATPSDVPAAPTASVSATTSQLAVVLPEPLAASIPARLSTPLTDASRPGVTGWYAVLAVPRGFSGDVMAALADHLAAAGYQVVPSAAGVSAVLSSSPAPTAPAAPSTTAPTASAAPLTPPAAVAVSGTWVRVVPLVVDTPDGAPVPSEEFVAVSVVSNANV